MHEVRAALTLALQSRDWHPCQLQLSRLLPRGVQNKRGKYSGCKKQRRVQNIAPSVKEILEKGGGRSESFPVIKCAFLVCKHRLLNIDIVSILKSTA